jgi:hypothetical protein
VGLNPSRGDAIEVQLAPVAASEEKVVPDAQPPSLKPAGDPVGSRAGAPAFTIATAVGLVCFVALAFIAWTAFSRTRVTSAAQSPARLTQAEREQLLKRLEGWLEPGTSPRTGVQ